MLMGKSRFVKPLVELTLVVVGVLLAFAIQAQWESRERDLQRAAYLDAIVVELELNRDRVQGLRNVVRARIAASDSTLAVAYGDSPIPPSNVLNGWFWSATGVGQFRAATSAVANLVQSDEWAEIADPALQSSVAALEAELAQMEHQATLQESYWFRGIDPYLRSRVDYRSWTGEGPSAAPEMNRSTATIVEAGWTVILTDQSFRNLLSHNRWFLDTQATLIDSSVLAIEVVLDQLHMLGG
jgi:hypothetical protein